MVVIRDLIDDMYHGDFGYQAREAVARIADPESAGPAQGYP